MHFGFGPLYVGHVESFAKQRILCFEVFWGVVPFVICCRFWTLLVEFSLYSTVCHGVSLLHVPWGKGRSKPHSVLAGLGRSCRLLINQFQKEVLQSTWPNGEFIFGYHAGSQPAKWDMGRVY